LSEIRGALGTLGRTENVIFDFRRRGDRREAVFALLLTGRGTDGRLRQEGGQIRAILVPDPSRRRAWLLASGALETWTLATASAPLFEESAARANLTKVHRAFLPTASKNIPLP